MSVSSKVYHGVMGGSSLLVCIFVAVPLGYCGPSIVQHGWWRRAYVFTDSNVDVLLLLLSCFACAQLSRSRLTARDARQAARIERVVDFLVKAVLTVLCLKVLPVAMVCQSQALPGQLSNAASARAPPPPPPGSCSPPPPPPAPSVVPVCSAGALCLFGSVIAAMVAVFALGELVKLKTRRELEAARNRGAGHGTTAGPPGEEPDPEETEPLLPPQLASAADPGAAGGGDEEEPPKLQSATVADLVQLASHQMKVLGFAFFFGGISAVSNALIPYYLGQAIDAASVNLHESWNDFLQPVLYMVVAAVVCAIAGGLRGGLFTLVSARMNADLRENLFGSLLKQETSFFDLNKTGDLTSRLSADTSTVADQISLNANVFARSLMSTVAILGAMFTISWRMSVVTIILVPAYLQIGQVYGEYLSKIYEDMQSALAAANVVADEVLASVTTVRAHAAGRGMQNLYRKEIENYLRLNRVVAAWYGGYVVITTVLPELVAAGVLLYGGYMVYTRSLGRGNLLSFMLYLQSLANSLSALGDIFASVVAAVGAAEKVMELLKRQPRETQGGSFVPSGQQQAGKDVAIQFVDVDFAYPSRPEKLVLRNVSLSISSGQVVALVGPSGAGKSSVVKLLERFYRPLRGRLLLYGRDLADYDDRWLKRHVAFVGQEPVLYARSIRDNIAFGLTADDGEATPPSEETIQRAVERANAAEFIKDMPEGLDTNCGDRGGSLSGGQKQRIAIARALVRDPRVLLLDEATSALDTESEAAVQAALNNVMLGRTVVIIAHRLSTVHNAHKIFAFKDGGVEDEGSHEELVERGGVYSSLVQRQLQPTRSRVDDPAAPADPPDVLPPGAGNLDE